MAKKFVNSLYEPVVQTKYGKLRGFVLDGIFTFHGIQYAAAERFQSPKPVEPWEGIKEATNYGYICPTLTNPAPSSELFIPHRFWPANEHCQYLNIWSAGLGEERKRPVMVWLHGGGYSDGSSIEQVAYEGDKLAEYGDVVVVTINHRLNILGFLDMSSFSEKYANSVNAGMADIVAALEWIKENIAAFGGDPDNVTVFGQSGGGGKVKSLMSIPEASGLYHRAIMMSGGCRVSKATSASHRALVEKMLQILNISIENVEELEVVPYEILNRAYQLAAEDEDSSSMRWEPVANDWYLGDPYLVGFTDYAKTVPTLVGTVLAEFTAMSRPEEYSLDENKQMEIVRNDFGETADELSKIFKSVYPDKPIINMSKMYTTTRTDAVHFADVKNKVSTAPTYLYNFALNFDIMGGVPAWHCSDIPFVFHNSERVACCNIEGITERLESQMAGAWVNFAYTGNPNHAGLPKWKPYGEDKSTMIFDRNSRCESDPDSSLIHKMNQVKTPLTIEDILKQNSKSHKNKKQEKNWMY